MALGATKKPRPEACLEVGGAAVERRLRCSWPRRGPNTSDQSTAAAWGRPTLRAMPPEQVAAGFQRDGTVNH
jgi:hypothetical protein